MSITRDEWLAELERVTGPTKERDSGRTRNELMADLGASMLLVTRMLTEAQKEGRLVVGRWLTTALDGRRTSIPVYSIKPAAKPAKPAKQPKRARE